MLFSACALGLLLRSLGYYDVFPPDGEVLLGVDDAQFHARRALFSFVNFPAVLDFDWFLAFPDGAAAPVPPLFDWATAGVARLFGDGERTLETVAAWVSPVTGALLVFPAWAIGRSVASSGVGLAAAGLTVVLPSGMLITRLGNFDHHGAVALVAACWLASSLSCVDRTGRSLIGRTTVQASVITLMLFTWSGSLLYVVLGAGAQVGAILLLHGSPERLAATAASLLGAAVPAALWLAANAAPLGGPFSSQTLSWLHVLTLLGIAGATLVLAAWELRRASTGPAARLLRLALVAGIAGLPLLALPSIRDQLLQGLSFLAQQDEWAAINPEQLPLFHSQTSAASASLRLGLFAYLVPLLPIYLGWRLGRTRKREELVLLLLWVLALTVLLLSQVRYGTDFTVPGAVAIAMLLADSMGGLARRLPAPAAGAIVVLLVGLALATPLARFHWPEVQAALLQMKMGDALRRALPMTSHEAAIRFGHVVRRATPEPGGFLQRGVRPEYGILVPPAFGHRFVYTARRPVPANNLGPYLDLKKYRLAKRFYRSRNSAEALRLLDRLSVRYVVTFARGARIVTFADHLHLRIDSAGEDSPSTGRLRLIAPAEPSPLTTRTARGDSKSGWGFPFRLFELVEGALLLVEAEPGTEVVAAIRLEMSVGRSVVYRTVGTAGADGVARVRVPYSTRQAGLVATPGPWRVRVGEREIPYEVSEVDVRNGHEVSAADRPDSERSAPRRPLQNSAGG